MSDNEYDFWNELDKELQASIERGLSQSARVEVHNHEKVMEKYRIKLSILEIRKGQVMRVSTSQEVRDLWGL